MAVSCGSYCSRACDFVSSTAGSAASAWSSCGSPCSARRKTSSRSSAAALPPPAATIQVNNKDRILVMASRGCASVGRHVRIDFLRPRLDAAREIEHLGETDLLEIHRDALAACAVMANDNGLLLGVEPGARLGDAIHWDEARTHKETESPNKRHTHVEQQRTRVRHRKVFLEFGRGDFLHDRLR